MTPEAIRRLYGYTYWAFEGVWNCLNQLNDEQFTRSLDYSMGSLRNQMVHVMSGTRRWIDRIRGEPISAHLSFEQYDTQAKVREKWDTSKEEVLSYVLSLSGADLDELVKWEIVGRRLKQSNRRWELLLHVANHATDHRAQILAMMHYEYRVKTVEQDMLFYLAQPSFVHPT